MSIIHEYSQTTLSTWLEKQIKEVNVHFYVVLKYMGLMMMFVFCFWKKKIRLMKVDVYLRKKKREDDEKRTELGVDGSL